MDNITHSLIGITAGEGIALASKKNRAKIWLASILGNNFPDSDVFYTKLWLKEPIGDLLHHRGHTHTFLTVPLQGLALFLLLKLLWRKEQDLPWREIALAAFLGPLLHVLADFTNSYGVHPFWPWNNDWHYGDFIFIVEPWIWVILIPCFIHSTASKVAKVIFGVLLAFILGLAAYHSLVPWFIFVPLTALAATLLLLYRAKSAGWRLSFSLACITVMYLVFFGTSARLNAKYSEPGTELAMTPLPGNPFCWTAMTASAGPEKYVATVSKIAAYPGIVSLEACRPSFPEKTMAPLRNADHKNTPDRKFHGEYVASRKEYEEISRSCFGDAFLRFARIPFWIKQGDGSVVFGDLRFDRNERLGFAKIVANASECPRSPNPPWYAPLHPQFHSH